MNKFLITFLIVLSTLSLKAGWVIYEVVTDNHGSRIEQRILVQKNKMKSEMGRDWVIYDLNNESISLIDTVLRIYCVGNVTQYNRGMVESIQEQMDVRLKEVPEDRKEEFTQYYQLLLSRWDVSDTVLSGDLKIKIVNKNQRENIANHAGSKYELWINDILRFEYVISDQVNFKTELDIDRFFWMMEKISGGTSLSGFENSPEYLDLMKSGYSLRTTDYDDDVTTITEVIEIKQKNIPGNEFKIPAGYRLVKFKEYFNTRPLD